MGWAYCGEDSEGRSIGYGEQAICDEEGCFAAIDRGLGYACGGMHGRYDIEGVECCEKYFCAEHSSGYPEKCKRCNGSLACSHEWEVVVDEPNGKLFACPECGAEKFEEPRRPKTPRPLL